MLNLKNTTLVTIDGVSENEMHLKALKFSCQNILFGEVKYFSFKNHGKSDFYEFIEIPKLSYDQYNNFCLVKLKDYIQTDYVIIVQDDGFIIHPDKWLSDFQAYDYIGAPWPKEHMFHNTKRWPFVHNKLIESERKYHVGNGGFCMRTKKLVDYVASIHTEQNSNIPEDVLIGVGYRKMIEENNMTFAPFEIARQFSCETMFVENQYTSPNETFGFHGRETHWAEVAKLNSIQL